MNNKQFWRHLTKNERSEYMRLQTAPTFGYGGYNLPDDCSECGNCNQPILGTGLCSSCSNRLQELLRKGNGGKR